MIGQLVSSEILPSENYSTGMYGVELLRTVHYDSSA